MLLEIDFFNTHTQFIIKYKVIIEKTDFIKLYTIYKTRFIFLILEAIFKMYNICIQK